MLYFGGFNLQDPDIFFNIYFRTGGSKRLEYSNPEVDKAIDEQRREVDLEKREELIRKTIKMILDDVPTILLYHHQKLYGVRERVVWKPTPEETVMVRDASVRK